MLIRKSQWMGISACLIAACLGVNPVMASATGAEEVVVFGSGYSVSEDTLESATDIGDITNEIDIDENEIWAQIDRDELRSFVDVTALDAQIDKEAILQKIDMASLRAQIDDEKIALQVDNDVHPVDVINVQLPVLGETSPFDFLIDPQNLVYATDAAKYGGGRVEEGANILFRNSDGEYMFSSKSDTITVVNRSNIPVRLSIHARISNPGGVSFVDSRGGLTGDDMKIFMALADDEGIASVVTEYGEATIDVVLDAAPDGTYDFRWNDNTGKYEYKLSDEDAEFDAFSFYIMADCNTEADWSGLAGNPVIEVSWKTEPIVTEEAELTEDEKELASEIEALVRQYLGMREVLTPADTDGEIGGEIEPQDSSDVSQNVVIIDEDVPGESDAVSALEEKEIEAPSESNIYRETVLTEVDQERVRTSRINNLIYQELLQLATDEYQRIYQEELDKLIEAEVDIMAKDLFEELKLRAIEDKKKKATDQEYFEEATVEETVEEGDVVEKESEETIVVQDAEEESVSEDKAEVVGGADAEGEVESSEAGEAPEIPGSDDSGATDSESSVSTSDTNEGNQEETDSGIIVF